jgi:hypothetical protein
MGRPSLALIKEHDTEDGFNLCHDPVKEDQWKIFFRMKIKNEGDGRAQNWRAWFTPLDDTTWILFDSAVARQEAYRKDQLSGRCETILDEKTRVLISALNLVRHMSFQGATRLYSKTGHPF